MSEQNDIEVEVAASEMRSGIKEVAQNEEVIAASEKVAIPVVDVQTPSFFIADDDRHRVEVDILFNPTNGQIVSVSRANIGLDFSAFQSLKHSTEWFEFSVPSYEDMATYRKHSSAFRKEAGKVLIDVIQLRNFILVWHLKDWSLRDKDGNKVELKAVPAGTLSDVSIKKVYSLPPTLIDVVLTIFEKDVLLA